MNYGWILIKKGKPVINFINSVEVFKTKKDLLDYYGGALGDLLDYYGGALGDLNAIQRVRLIKWGKELGE